LPPFEIGMTIDSDRIKLLDFVGQGSFAHVYLGYDYSTSSKCAVKCLMKAGADPKKMAMQKREVNAMEDLNGHPNVIRLIRTVDTSEWLLIIMEFYLYEAIMQKGGFPDFAVKDVFSQLCDGVMHCHSRGYYHRDLKPENILLDVAALTAKITDFGLATRDTWCYEMGCGSTRYIPPEACATADPTKGYSPIASDVWALGILLVNLLFSKNPWFEATMTDPIFSIYVTSRPDILRHHFKISAEFDSILRRVFSLDPSKRLSLPEFKRLINSLPSF
ncbi:kinase-like domain-containing protein, partial [Obelidium mucronatum]